MTTWGLGVGRAGTLSLARQLDGEHNPSPGIGPDLDDDGLKEVLRERLGRDRASVDRLHSLVIPQIRSVDPEARFIWLLRDPFSNVRSMLDTRHLEVRDSRYYPIPSEPDSTRAAAWVWSNINSSIWRDLEGHNDWQVCPTQSLSIRLGSTNVPRRLSDTQHSDIMCICGELWGKFWELFPELTHEVDLPYRDRKQGLASAAV